MTRQSLPEEVVLCEVGPRDGLQNEKSILSARQKIELIERVAEAGAKVIEIGSFVHPKAVPAMADTDEVARGILRREGVEYRALVMNRRGLERALAAGVTKAKLTVSASPTHSAQNSKRAPGEVVAGFEECAAFAQSNGIVLSGAISTAFGYYAEGHIGLELVTPLVDAYIALGVTEISMSDSTGFANPKQVFGYMTELSGKYPKVVWTLHAHNTKGMAMANIYAALTAGVTRFDSSLAGIGGCPFAPGASGNIATEDVVFMMEEMGIRTGFSLGQILEAAESVERMIGHEGDSSMLKLRRGKAAEKSACTSPASAG
ncbi:MAG: hydroxymethylglutaryl-CoA lyase [Synergistaceae bacterium]|nr:hydroxymethylglutaryl-CoA lyase [Synergistaceae bacterium]